MSDQSSGYGDEREWSHCVELQLAVLLYLSMNGPMPWIDIYTHFEKQEGGCQPHPGLGLFNWSEDSRGASREE